MTNVEHTTSKIARQRLPNRRPAHTEALDADGQALVATVGFDPKSGQPRELFLTACKEGSLLNALLADAAVVISVALQHGIPAAALARPIGRLPAGPVTPANLERPGPAELDHSPIRNVPASPISAALDLLRRFEEN